MRTLVIYDSNHGSTKIIAENIAERLDAKAKFVSNCLPGDLKALDLLIIGSPIIGWRPSEKMSAFLGQLKADDVKHLKVATFDTRVKLFIHGDAMEKIARIFSNLGASTIVESMPFYVKGQQGGLLRGEIEKAVKWADSIKNRIKN